MNPAVLVCRGCCCGTDKHADIDHEQQLRVLRSASDVGSVEVRVTECLGPCGNSNLVALWHGDGSRSWLGEILSPESTEALAAWLAAGGSPGDRPTALDDHSLHRLDPRLFTPDHEITYLNR